MQSPLVVICHCDMLVNQVTQSIEQLKKVKLWQTGNLPSSPMSWIRVV